MHPVNDFVTRVCQVVPVILMGFSLKAVLLLVPFLVFFVIVLHSNLNWDYGWFRWVLVSPLYHRWHHTTDPEGLDKNFAGIFPIWDLLFGTAHFPRREPVTFGVNHNPPPESFWGQLLYPFQRGCAPCSIEEPALCPRANPGGVSAAVFCWNLGFRRVIRPERFTRPLLVRDSHLVPYGRSRAVSGVTSCACGRAVRTRWERRGTARV